MKTLRCAFGNVYLNEALLNDKFFNVKPLCCASTRAYSHDPQPPPIIPFGEPTPNLGANCPLTMFSYELYFSDTVPGISPLLNIISRLSNMYSIWRAAGQTRGKLPRHDILLFAPHARISRPSASVMNQTQTFEILNKWRDTA